MSAALLPLGERIAIELGRGMLIQGLYQESLHISDASG